MTIAPSVFRGSCARTFLVLACSAALSASASVTVLSAPAAAVTPAPPPATATVDVVDVSGSNNTPFVKSGPMTYSAAPESTSSSEEVPELTSHGCAQGTTAVALSSDKMAMTVTYNDLIARMGPNIPASDATVICDVNLVLNIPPGYTYAISKVVSRGFASLAQGVSGVFISAYHFVGYPVDFGATLLSGPMEGNWNADAVPEESVYAPCEDSPTLNLQTVLNVTGTANPPSRLSYVAMDSQDPSFLSTYHVAWATCD